MTNKLSYKFLKIIVVLFILLYAFIGIAARFSSNKEEDFYPFFSWFLFSNVPPRIQHDFSIRIFEAGNKKFDPPIFFEHAKEIYNPNFSSVNYFNIIRSLGTSIKQNNKDNTQRLREQLESNFVIHPVTYELVEVTFNPIERFKSGKVQDTKTIEKFTTGEKNNGK